MPDNQIEHTEIQSYEHNEIFETEEEMRESLSRLCYGDLYVIGRMWIEVLKTGLLGYKDLPLYQTPHYEYKDYEADRDKCPNANFKNYMQCPKNLAVRQAVVALGGVAGYYIGSAKGLPTRIFTTGLGLLATGALCFPKETDTAFRTFTYHTAKTARTVYNAYCKKMSGLKERVNILKYKDTSFITSYLVQLFLNEQVPYHNILD
ncbi:Apolipoprotein O domain containing protein, partial [Operophtera brumata]